MRDHQGAWHCSDHQPAGHLSFLLDSNGLAEPTSGPPRVGQTDCLTLSTATQFYFLTRQPPSSPAGDTRLQVTLSLAQGDSPRQQAVCL